MKNKNTGGGGNKESKPAIKRTPVERLALSYDRFYGTMLKFSGANLLKNPGAREKFAEVLISAQTLEKSMGEFVAMVTPQVESEVAVAVADSPGLEPVGQETGPAQIQG